MIKLEKTEQIIDFEKKNYLIYTWLILILLSPISWT